VNGQLAALVVVQFVDELGTVITQADCVQVASVLQPRTGFVPYSHSSPATVHEVPPAGACTGQTDGGAASQEPPAHPPLLLEPLPLAPLELPDPPPLPEAPELLAPLLPPLPLPPLELPEPPPLLDAPELLAPLLLPALPSPPPPPSPTIVVKAVPPHAPTIADNARPCAH